MSANEQTDPTASLGNDADPLSSGTALPTGSALDEEPGAPIDGGRPDAVSSGSDVPADTLDADAMARGDSDGASSSTEDAASR